MRRILLILSAAACFPALGLAWWTWSSARAASRMAEARAQRAIAMAADQRVEPSNRAAEVVRPGDARRRPRVSQERSPHDPEGRAEPDADAAQADLRRRVAEAQALQAAAQAGDADAAVRLEEAQARAVDPRLRAALAGQAVSGMAESARRRRYPTLPEPAARATAGALDVCWTSARHDDLLYESRVLVGADGQALVETRSMGSDVFHVRYRAWAWRDAAGNLVLDARGQDVEVLQRPPHGWWSPDSMVVTPGGSVELIDDKFADAQGATGAGVSG